MGMFKWLYPGIGIKRWVFLIIIGIGFIVSGLLFIIGTTYFIQYIQIITRISSFFDRKVYTLLIGVFSMIIGIVLLVSSVRKFLISLEHMCLQKMKKSCLI